MNNSPIQIGDFIKDNRCGLCMIIVTGEGTVKFGRTWLPAWIGTDYKGDASFVFKKDAVLIAQHPRNQFPEEYAAHPEHFKGQ